VGVSKDMEIGLDLTDLVLQRVRTNHL